MAHEDTRYDIVRLSTTLCGVPCHSRLLSSNVLDPVDICAPFASSVSHENEFGGAISS